MYEIAHDEKLENGGCSPTVMELEKMAATVGRSDSELPQRERAPVKTGAQCSPLKASADDSLLSSSSLARIDDVVCET